MDEKETKYFAELIDKKEELRKRLDEMENKSTEDKLQEAIELYEFDSSEWDFEILLDELERLYNLRETINQLIFTFKRRIVEEVGGNEQRK